MARKRQNSDLPTFDELIIPTVKALLKLGGSGTIEEINTKVYEIADLPDDVLQIPHGEQGATNEVEYRLAWTRTYLKKFGLLENSSRGIWALSKANVDINSIDPEYIKRAVREKARPEEQKNEKDPPKRLEKEIEDEVEKTEE